MQSIFFTFLRFIEVLLIKTLHSHLLRSSTRRLVFLVEIAAVRLLVVGEVQGGPAIGVEGFKGRSVVQAQPGLRLNLVCLKTQSEARRRRASKRSEILKLLIRKPIFESMVCLTKNRLTRRFPTVSYALVSAGANLAHFDR